MYARPHHASGASTETPTGARTAVSAVALDVPNHTHEWRRRDSRPPTNASKSFLNHCLSLKTFQTPLALYSERFHDLLTLSSECFSTFPHGTCSLSVLWIYLALDRVYDLLSAAFSSNATLREKATPIDFACTHTGLTPSMELPHFGG